MVQEVALAWPNFDVLVLISEEREVAFGVISEYKYAVIVNVCDNSTS